MNKLARHKTALRYGALGLTILVVWLVENVLSLFFAPNNFELYLMVGVVTAIGMLEEELPAALFGLAAGLLTDLFTPGQFGYNAVIMMLIGLVTSLLITHVMRSTISTDLIFSGGAMLLYVVGYWMVMLVFKGIDHSVGAFFTMFLPRAAVSFLFCPFLYIFIRRIRKLFLA